MRIGWQLSVIGLAVLGLGSGRAVATLPGGFQLLDDQSSESMTPDTNPPCFTEASKSQMLSGNAVLTAAAGGSSRAEGTAGNCDESSKGAATAQGKFVLDPDESTPGAPVQLCAILEWALEIERQGDAAAVAHVQAALGVGSTTVLRVLGRSLSDSGVGEGPEEAVQEFICATEFTAKIGDMLFASAGGSGATKLGGVGAAASEGEILLVVEQGPCPDLPSCPIEIVNEAPALSNAGLGAACFVLLLVGAGVVRRRSTRVRQQPAA